MLQSLTFGRPKRGLKQSGVLPKPKHFLIDYMSELIHNHYQQIAGIFEDLWFYSEDFVQFITNKIIEHLSLKNTDFLIDLGCGTGIYAKEINNQMELHNPIICVDSSNKMLEQIPNNIKYKCIEMDAVEFSALSGTYNKIIIKELIHHINELDLLLGNLFQRLTDGGILLLILLPPTIDYPLFSTALRKYEEFQPNYNNLASLLAKIGFHVAVNFVEYPLEIPKSKYFQMVQNRYMSLLSTFDDEQLALGLNEMEQKYAQQSILKFSDRFVFITASKP
jgi:ubiquinone/menaquinone biosynthesis C-methylase UbiE